MPTRITAANSRFVTTGNAFWGTAGPDRLTVDNGAYLIADSTTSSYGQGEGARLDGTWTVTINGFVGAFGEGDISHAVYRSGLLLHTTNPADLATVTIGKTGRIHGTDNGIESLTALKVVNHGLIDSYSAIVANGPLDLTNDGRIVGNVWCTSADAGDVFRNFTKVGKTMKSGTVVGTIQLGSGDDRFFGGAKAETVLDGKGSDVYRLGGGNDVFFGRAPFASSLDSAGTDIVDGGAGTDTYDGSATTAGFSINFDSVQWLFTPAGTATDVGIGSPMIGTDRISNFERVVGGSGNDWMFGNAGANIFVGGGGEDFLMGGRGRDTLTGGDHADRFFYTSIAESLPKARDVITDFRRGYDSIDLLNIDANGNAPGDAGFTFIGVQPFHGVRGELRISFLGGDTLVSADVNGDRKADFAILLKGLMVLEGSDFNL